MSKVDFEVCERNPENRILDVRHGIKLTVAEQCPVGRKGKQTALGLPAVYSNTDVDKQAAFLRSRISVEDLKDPVKLDNFLTRFTAKWQAANGAPGQTVPQIGLGRPTLATFDNSLLLSMQLLRRSGR